MKLDKKVQTHGIDLAPLATSMDGPSVAFTVNDLFKFNNTLYLTYHVMSAGYDVLTPLGCLVGGAVLPMVPKYSHLTPLQAAGTGGIVGGCAGLGLGFLALLGTAASKNPKIPMTKEGIQQRVDGLSHNYMVRAMDLGVWLGIAAAGGALYRAGGSAEKAFGLSAGLLGQLQAIALGSAVGTVGASVIIKATK